MRFHRRCGDRVTLLNDNTTAFRNLVEFNHGLILSAEPLIDDILFEVTIDVKVNIWNGSLEIGATSLDPDILELPATATKLRNEAWILSGSSVVKDGATLLNDYGPELDSLAEGQTVGVMKTSKNELMFYVNGRCLGIAARDVPSRLFAVIDLYGQCVQVTITNPGIMRPIMESSLDQIEEDPNNDDTLSSSEMEGAVGPAPMLAGPSAPSAPPEAADTAGPSDPCRPIGLITDYRYFRPMTSAARRALAVTQDRLRFHPRCGILVKLTDDNRTAERSRPLDDYNNGVVMTHRPLNLNELFQIRIDRLVDKWSGSIEVGVTTHNPATVRFPSTMTNMDCGTIMMSGCKVLINGHGTCLEYGNINLDELREGDTIGMMIKSNGKLHYYINNIDQGVASDSVEQKVWGVVDLYGMTVKVTILDSWHNMQQYAIKNPLPEDTLEATPAILPRDFTPEPTPRIVPRDATPELIPRIIPRDATPEPTPGCFRPANIDEHSLSFHTLRDSNVIIINNGKTAHRPNAFEHFNNGVVMTNRTLRKNELFQVRLDLVVPKWAGSIEIGVTQHSYNQLQLPFNLSNTRCSTWSMTGEDVIRNGTIIIPQYVRNLNELVEGNTVGVMRKDLGILHFFVNGVDQGPAAFNVPDNVYGIVDLYGRVATTTIVDARPRIPIFSPESLLSSDSNTTIFPEMCFHAVHGRNARLNRNRLMATRATVYSEFNDAVLFSSRPLRECEMFELRIDRMVDCWIGSLEIGVTAIKPEDLEANGGVGAIAGTATDLSRDTYILSGAAMMTDGECVRSGYQLDLDTLTVGSRVGMMRHADRSLHYYLDGMDQGRAWHVPHLNIYAVIDLYGQCTQVTILQNEERQFHYNECVNSENSILSNPRTYMSPPPPYCSFSEYCGDNVCLMFDYSFARRMSSLINASLVFSSGHLIVGEMFEIMISAWGGGYQCGMRLGITDINILNAHVNYNLPDAIALLPPYTAYIDGNYMLCSRAGCEMNVSSIGQSFDCLSVQDRIRLLKTEDGRVQVYYNMELLDAAFEDVPDKVYMVMELYGCVSKIQAVPKELAAPIIVLPEPSAPIEEVVQVYNTILDVDPLASPTKEGEQGAIRQLRRELRPLLPYTFHYVHGRNIKLTSSDTVAIRTCGYNHGVAVVTHRLRRGKNFRFRVDKLSGDWSGSVSVGAVGTLPYDPLPASGLMLDPPAWVVSNEVLNDNSTYISTDFASALEDLVEQSVLTLRFRCNGELFLEVDGKVLGLIATVPTRFKYIYPLIDLYGKVSQISVLLHPLVIPNRSVDHPILIENLEAAIAEMDLGNEENIADVDPEETFEALDQGNEFFKTYSCDNIVDDECEEQELVESGPSTPAHKEISPEASKNQDIESLSQPIKKMSLHYSFTDAPTANDKESASLFPRSNSLNQTFIYQDNEDDGWQDDYPIRQDDDSTTQNDFSNLEDCIIQNDDEVQADDNEQNDADNEQNDEDIELNEEDIEQNDEDNEPNDDCGSRSEGMINQNIECNLPESSGNVIDDLNSSHNISDLQQEDCLSPINDANMPYEECVSSDNEPNIPLDEECVTPDNDRYSQLRERCIGVIYPQATTARVAVPQRANIVLNRFNSLANHDEFVRHEQYYDTNIRLNDQYPEVNDVDNIDNEIINALTLDGAANLPDLTEEQSSSNDSTRDYRCEAPVEPMCFANFKYFNNLFNYYLDEIEEEANLDLEDLNINCEHLHLVLKFWHEVTAPYTDLREIITSWSQVRCFCSNCVPEEDSFYSGFVRIQCRADAFADDEKRRFWHFDRSRITTARVMHENRIDPACVGLRPSLAANPPTVPRRADTWYDEEGKAHYSMFVLEIEANVGAGDDYLLSIMIYLKSQPIYIEAQNLARE